MCFEGSAMRYEIDRNRLVGYERVGGIGLDGSGCKDDGMAGSQVCVVVLASVKGMLPCSNSGDGGGCVF